MCRPPEMWSSARHVRSQIRVAVAVAEHQRAKRDALSGLRDRGEQRHALEMEAVGIAEPRARTVHAAGRRQRKEMILDENRVDAEHLRLQPETAKGSVVGVLGLDLDADANLPHA